MIMAWLSPEFDLPDEAAVLSISRNSSQL